ncbi:MAG: PAS domain S-box protein, partial [Desulfuromonadaceae bacterium]
MRANLIGLGEASHRKSYYPELQQRLGELERFKALLDHSNDAIFLIEVPTARIVDVNEACCRQLDRQREELLALSIFAVSDLEQQAPVARLICNGTRHLSEDALVEAQLFRRDEEAIPVEITLSRKVLHETDLAYVIAVARDITKRRQAEEALRKSEIQYHTLAEVSPVGIFYIDNQGDILYVNERWCEITGFCHNGLPDEEVWQIFPTTREAVLASWFEAAEEGKVYKLEFCFDHPAGHVSWAYSQVMAERSDRGEVLGFVGALSDITERKRSEEALLRSEESRLRLQTELEFAAHIQQLLLPDDPPTPVYLDIAAQCTPARQVGGDFYDWQEPSPNTVALNFGDVMGKGMGAAMLMATVRSALRSVSQHPPAAALRQVERSLGQDLDRSESFVTLFHARISLSSGKLTYVDCGHGFVFLFRLDGTVEELLPRGLPLGVPSPEGYREGSVNLSRGDALVLYSDGLIDALPELSLDA